MKLEQFFKELRAKKSLVFQLAMDEAGREEARDRMRAVDPLNNEVSYMRVVKRIGMVEPSHPEYEKGIVSAVEIRFKNLRRTLLARRIGRNANGS